MVHAVQQSSSTSDCKSKNVLSPVVDLDRSGQFHRPSDQKYHAISHAFEAGQKINLMGIAPANHDTDVRQPRCEALRLMLA